MRFCGKPCCVAFHDRLTVNRRRNEVTARRPKEIECDFCHAPVHVYRTSSVPSMCRRCGEKFKPSRALFYRRKKYFARREYLTCLECGVSLLLKLGRKSLCSERCYENRRLRQRLSRPLAYLKEVQARYEQRHPWRRRESARKSYQRWRHTRAYQVWRATILRKFAGLPISADVMKAALLLRVFRSRQRKGASA